MYIYIFISIFVFRFILISISIFHPIMFPGIRPRWPKSLCARPGQLAPKAVADRTGFFIDQQEEIA